MNNKILTPLEIYEKMGWEDPSLFAARRRDENSAYPGMPYVERRVRRTGRTTRIIAEALSCVSHGKAVTFTAANHSIAHDIAERARECAEKLGLNTNLIIPAREVVTFSDHSYPEVEG